MLRAFNKSRIPFGSESVVITWTGKAGLIKQIEVTWVKVEIGHTSKIGMCLKKNHSSKLQFSVMLQPGGDTSAKLCGEVLRFGPLGPEGPL